MSLHRVPYSTVQAVEMKLDLSRKKPRQGSSQQAHPPPLYATGPSPLQILFSVGNFCSQTDPKQWPGTFDEKYKGKTRYLVYSSSKSDREKYREAVEKWNRIKAEVDARKYDAEKEARESEKKRLESVTKTGESNNRKYNPRLVKAAIRKYGVSRTRLRFDLDLPHVSSTRQERDIEPKRKQSQQKKRHCTKQEKNAGDEEPISRSGRPPCRHFAAVFFFSTFWASQLRSITSL